MHVSRMHSQPPERHSAHFVSRVLGRVLDDAVAGSDFMQEEIPVGMDDLVAQSIGYGESPSIDHGSRRSRDDGADMAG